MYFHNLSTVNSESSQRFAHKNKNQPLHACKVGRSPLNTMKPACALAKGTRTGDWNVSFLVGRHSLPGYTMTKMMDVPFQERLRDPSQTDSLGYLQYVPREFRELLWVLDEEPENGFLIGVLGCWFALPGRT